MIHRIQGPEAQAALHCCGAAPSLRLTLVCLMSSYVTLMLVTHQSSKSSLTSFYTIVISKLPFHIACEFTYSARPYLPPHARLQSKG